MKLKLVDKRYETADVVSFIFHAPMPVIRKAGQFFHYVLPHEIVDERGTERWFTISSAPFEEKIMITTRIDSQKSSSFKKTLVNLKVGDEIDALDLGGDFTVDDPNGDFVFIAGGIGITPFRSILKQLDHEGAPINVTLLYSNRDQNVVFKEELEEIAKKNPSFKIYYIFSPEHIDEEKIRKYVADLQSVIFYVSGPEPMVESVGQLLHRMGVPEGHIKQDWFPGYPEV